jgi:hypothetical protein
LFVAVRPCLWMEVEFRIDRPNRGRVAHGCMWLLAGGFWPRWCSDWCSRWARVRAQRCSGGRYTSACRRWLVVQRLANSGAKASAEVATARTATRQVANFRGVRRFRTTPSVVLALNLLIRLPATPSIGVTRCIAEVLRRGIPRGDPGSIGPRLCGILHPNFRENLF